jgi:hypothetical protein
MSYQINKTNGELLTELVDGSIDISSTDLTLVGRNYKGYGEAFNENFVSLLENFSSSSAPSNPLKGQLWYDTSDNRLKIYDGTSFRAAGGPIVSPDQPTQLVEGDLWIDNRNNKLYMWDGTDLTLVGPNYTASQGKTIYEAVTMIDTSNTTRTVLALYIGGLLVGILSRAEFTPATAYVLPPYEVGRVIKVGFNPVDVSTYKFHGTSSATEALVDDQGTEYTSNDFVRTNERDSLNNVVDQSMLGSLFVKGNDGLSIGIGDTRYAQFRVPQLSTVTVIETLQSDYDFAIRVQKGNDSTDAITIDTGTSSVGIFNSSPEANLDVTGSGNFTGNLTVGGNLTIDGDTTTVNTTTLAVEDKNIELGVTNTPTDITANGGGITLKGASDKTITWLSSTTNWTFNQNIDLTTGKEFRIEDTQVLSKTRLGDTVTTANGLTSIGTLTELTVSGDINIGGNLVNSGPMSITTGGDITLNSVKIIGLADPGTDDSAATNKSYVDNKVATIPTSFSLDITGLTSPNPAGTGDGPINDVKNILDDIAPVSADNNDAIARVHCVSYADSVVSGISVSISTDPDTSGTLTKTVYNYDSAGTQNASGIQDIVESNTTSGTFTPSPSRYTMTFLVDGGVWTHQTTTNYI